MSRERSLRVTVWCAQAEIALVRRDAVAGPLLAQAARAAAGTPAAAYLDAAAELARRAPADHAPARKVVQALTRAAATMAQAELLEAPG